MADKKYDDTNRGMLFRVADKETDKHPDLNGRLNIDGVDYWISGWWKKYTDTKGDGGERTGVSLSLGKRVQSKTEAKRVDTQTSGRRQQSRGDNDDVPF